MLSWHGQSFVEVARQWASLLPHNTASIINRLGEARRSTMQQDSAARKSLCKRDGFRTCKRVSFLPKLQVAGNII